MNSTIKHLALQPGDRIVIPKSQMGMVQHHALYIGTNSSGEDLIIENKIGYGIRIVTAKDFFSECIGITKVERFCGTNQERRSRIERALSMVGVPYDLITYNCEHFANDIQHGIARSRQIETGLLALAIAAVFWLNPNKK
jgi:hypothetical protein